MPSFMQDEESGFTRKRRIRPPRGFGLKQHSENPTAEQRAKAQDDRDKVTEVLGILGYDMAKAFDELKNRNKEEPKNG